MLEKIWKLFSTGMTFYTVYNTLNNANKAKTEIYNSLDPEQQAQWNKVLGDPSALSKVGSWMPPIPPINVPASKEGTKTSIIPVGDQTSAVKAGV